MNDVFQNIKKSINFMKNCKKEIILIIVLGLLVTIISVVTPTINGNIINKMLELDFNIVIVLIILYGFLEILGTTFNFLISKNYLTFKKKYSLNIRKAACRSLLNFNMSEYYNNDNGKILNKIQNDSVKIVTFFNNIKECLLVAMTNVGSIIYIFYYNCYIGIYYLITLLISLLIRYYGVKKSIYYRKKMFDVSDSNLTLLNELIYGAKDIKGFALKEKFINKTDDSFEQISDYEYKSTLYLEYSDRAAKFIESIFSGFMVIFSIFLISKNLLFINEFIIIYMYKKNVYGISNKIANLINYLGLFNLSSTRVFSVLEYKKEEFGDVDIIVEGKITFKNIDFAYDKKEVLKDFNLDIQKNSFISIVGPSGSGKTTILNLISKMYTTKNGTVLIDDNDINKLSEKTIRNSIALVNQKPYLFNLSIKENLDISGSSFEEIKRICKLVGIDKKIESLDEGYDTKLSSDAYMLSGGEKQKLAIARALLSNAKIILLDEITSNLDNESSNEIKKVLKKIKRKYTIVMVTHDLDMASCSDRVIMLNKGKIIADGTHEKLLKENEKYKNLYNVNKVGEV